MTDQSPNDMFHASSFMQGHNAEYLEQLYAQYANDPSAVDAAWAEFFAAMGDNELDVKKEAAGPSWARGDWPPVPGDEREASTKAPGNRCRTNCSTASSSQATSSRVTSRW